MLARLWKDNAFQFRICLVILALLCSASHLFAQPTRSSLVAIDGQIERVERRAGFRYVSAKLILFLRTPTGHPLVPMKCETPARSKLL